MKSTLAQLNLIARPAPTAPTFYFQEVNDELVAAGPVDQLVAANCAKGATIDYVRGLTGGHIAGEVPYFTRALLYLKSRFAGQPATNTCPATPPSSTSPPTAAPPAGNGGGSVGNGGTQSVGALSARSGATGELAFTGLDAGLPLVALGLLDAGLALQRFRRSSR